MICPDSLLDAVRASQRIVFFTGAGVSAESGIPTFRDRQTGLWERYDALELATPQAFARDPALVWGWYEWRRAQVSRAQPNAAHRAIALLAQRSTRVSVITQNVDDLHERAGSEPVVHLHGRLELSRCSACGQSYGDMDVPSDVPEGGRRIEPPCCLVCGERVRPGVVWFGETLPAAQWQAAMQATEDCDLFFCVGTSSLVQPAASLTLRAKSAGALIVQVNPNSTELDAAVDVILRGAAGTVLPELLQGMR